MVVTDSIQVLHHHCDIEYYVSREHTDDDVLRCSMLYLSM
jgi:hypothetical protein